MPTTAWRFAGTEGADDAVSRMVLERTLRGWGHEVVATRDGDEAWAALLAEDAPSLAILDWMMPRKDGISVCRELRQQTDRAYVYILLLTARSQQRDLVEGLGAGADDYLTKPYSGEELRARLFSGERILEVQQQLVAAREALRMQAIRDPLTGLFNRRYMGEALERELRRAEHGGQPLSMIMLDVDHFKRFNDTFGHDAGDFVLQSFADLLRGFFRGDDVACRCGGEEFAVILPESLAANAALRPDRRRQSCRRRARPDRRRDSCGRTSYVASPECRGRAGRSAD